MTETRMVFRQTGGPEVIERETFALTAPGPGEVVVRHSAVGLNFIDIYFRSGLYPTPLPSGLGSEAAGRIEAVGEGVTGFSIGDHVAYATSPLGAYATARTMAADPLIRLPDDIADEVAAAAMLKGMTAAFLSDRCARVAAGQTALVHAAAGGVGSILVPWLVARGVTVLAHTGSPEKAARASAAGARTSLSCPLDDLAPAVRAATDGRGVDVVFDSVGAASWAASLASVASRGMIVSFGNASGPLPPIDPRTLLTAGSVFFTRPSLFDYARAADERLALADALFAMIRGGLDIAIGQRFALGDAVDAHRALAARSTTGSTILTV